MRPEAPPQTPHLPAGPFFFSFLVRRGEQEQTRKEDKRRRRGKEEKRRRGARSRRGQEGRGKKKAERRSGRRGRRRKFQAGAERRRSRGEGARKREKREKGGEGVAGDQEVCGVDAGRGQKALPRVELGFFFASGGDLPPTAPLRRAGRRRSANLKQPHLATRPAANNNKNTRLDTHPDAFCLRHLLPQSFFAPRQFFCSLPASPRLLSASSSSFLLMSFSLFLFLFFSPSLESAPSPEVRPSRCPAPTPSPRLNHPR